MCGVAFVGAASGLSLLLNTLTDEWFSCAAFVLLWCIVLVMIVRRCIREGRNLSPAKDWDVPVMIFWTTVYGFSLAALVHLGIASAVPLFFVFGVLLLLGTLYLTVWK